MRSAMPGAGGTRTKDSDMLCTEKSDNQADQIFARSDRTKTEFEVQVRRRASPAPALKELPTR